MVKIDQDELFSHMQEELRSALLVGFGGIVALFLLTMLLSRRLTDPLYRLSNTASRLAQGDLSARSGL